MQNYQLIVKLTLIHQKINQTVYKSWTINLIKQIKLQIYNLLNPKSKINQLDIAI